MLTKHGMFPVGTTSLSSACKAVSKRYTDNKKHISNLIILLQRSFQHSGDVDVLNKTEMFSPKYLVSDVSKVEMSFHFLHSLTSEMKSNRSVDLFVNSMYILCAVVKYICWCV